MQSLSHARAADLASTFVVLAPDKAATPVAVTPTLFDELDRRFDGFRDHVLVSSFAFDCDWSTWERHPAGDEVVCLLSGAVTMVLDRDGAEETIELREPGSFVIVPRATWHTARTEVPTRMLFVTPGEATQNRAVA